jgi:hypothetical protein
MKQTYGKPFVKKGIEYVNTMIWYKRPFFKMASGIQYLLWKLNIHWHMKWPISQCTPNFSCCVKNLRKQKRV